jgi:hypothetical protein
VAVGDWHVGCYLRCLRSSFDHESDVVESKGETRWSSRRIQDTLSDLWAEEFSPGHILATRCPGHHSADRGVWVHLDSKNLKSLILST